MKKNKKKHSSFSPNLFQIINPEPQHQGSHSSPPPSDDNHLTLEDSAKKFEMPNLPVATFFSFGENSLFRSTSPHQINNEEGQPSHHSTLQSFVYNSKFQISNSFLYRRGSGSSNDTTRATTSTASQDEPFSDQELDECDDEVARLTGYYGDYSFDKDSLSSPASQNSPTAASSQLSEDLLEEFKNMLSSSNNFSLDNKEESDPHNKIFRTSTPLTSNKDMYHDDVADDSETELSRLILSAKRRLTDHSLKVKNSSDYQMESVPQNLSAIFTTPNPRNITQKRTHSRHRVVDSNQTHEVSSDEHPVTSKIAKRDSAQGFSL